jgi:cytochrome c
MDKAFIVVAVLMTAGGFHLAHGGSADKGKVLFESTTLGGATSGKSCATCHDGGKGLGSSLFERKHFILMGREENSLADVVNACIEQPLGGTALDPRGDKMNNLIAYMKTLIKQPAKK